MSESKIRVLLVDDSAVIRGLLGRILEEDPQIELVGTRSNGEAAITAVERHKPDIVVLDIEMPVMDGLTALPLLFQKSPDTKVLICSTLSHKNADVSIKALTLGASECILKPSTSRDITQQQSFHHNLVNLVRTITGHAPRDFDREGKIVGEEALARKSVSQIVKAPVPQRDQVTLRKLNKIRAGGCEAVAIGSSTGGPQALFTVLKECTDLRVPLFITQHMPPTFTQILAQHIEQKTGIKTQEAQNSMRARAGEIYIAPGGQHMKVKGDIRNMYIELDDGPPVNYCKPSVEPMVRSLVEICQGRFLTVILTGMGQDGFSSCCLLPDYDAPLIAQDAETSIVWGMPGTVAAAGICTDVLPVTAIGGKIMEYVGVNTHA